jgi:16S rRNA (guanine966-N2)-methyltransferase
VTVRVLSGEARGRRLRVPGGGRTRPTASVVREALFDILAHRGWVAGRVVIDLYAGSGALGIEAASRGAARVVFVEESRAVARILRENVGTAVGDTPADVLVMPVARALATLVRRGCVADGIVADPPYGRGLVDRTIADVLRTGVLSPGGWLAVEHAARERPTPVSGLVLEVERRYGSTAMSILSREEEAR